MAETTLTAYIAAEPPVEAGFATFELDLRRTIAALQDIHYLSYGEHRDAATVEHALVATLGSLLASITADPDRYLLPSPKGAPVTALEVRDRYALAMQTRNLPRRGG